MLADKTALGLSGQVLYADLAGAQSELFEAAQPLVPRVLAGLVIAAVLSVILPTVDSARVSAAAASRGWPLERVPRRNDLKSTYVVVTAIAASAILSFAVFAK